jgi:hypothetical protein
MPDILSIMSFFTDLADKFRLLDAVKTKLLGAPDVASDKLVAALQEIAKMYRVIDGMLASYLSLDFDQTSKQEERKLLLQIEGGEIKTQVSEARGHCHKIGKIYHAYLKRWFGKVLARDEQAQMKGLFQTLSDMDFTILKYIDQVAWWLTDEATATLDLVDQNQLDAANQHVRAANKEVLPLRRIISETMSKLFELQAEFIAQA